MRLVRFLSRLAFICNICFVLASVLRYLPPLPDNEVTQDIITLGYIVAIVLNLFVNLIVVILFALKRLWTSGVSRWLLLTNFIFFVLQIIFFYRLNQPIQ